MTEETMRAVDLPEPAEFPKPTGYRILIRPAVVEETSEGGIILSDSIQDANKHLTYVGQVIAMGDQCYTHEKFQIAERDPKPWCKVGDYVLYKQYTGQPIDIRGKDGSTIQMLILNDDEIKGVIDDPGNYVAYA